jgi:hypothetical protein
MNFVLQYSGIWSWDESNGAIIYVKLNGSTVANSVSERAFL